MATRGRPRKVEVLTADQPKSIQWIIAEVTHDNCGMPGCQTKMHLGEAAEIINALKENGFIIKVGN